MISTTAQELLDKTNNLRTYFNSQRQNLPHPKLQDPVVVMDIKFDGNFTIAQHFYLIVQPRDKLIPTWMMMAKMDLLQLPLVENDQRSKIYPVQTILLLQKQQTP